MFRVVAENANINLEGQLGFFAQCKEDVHCVFGRDPAAHSVWEILLTYSGVHAVLTHRVTHRLWKANWKLPARLIAAFCKTITGVDIHPGATIGRRLFIDHALGVVIGETAEIGNDVTLYHGVTLGGTSWNKGRRHPTLADGVVVGAGAKILGPISIGARVRVGANSVVVKDVPADCTVVGVPGRIVDTRAGSLRPENGISLDHNLLPDPVAKSIACLIERIESMEKELAELRHEPPPAEHDAECLSCTAGDLCCENEAMH